VISSFTCPFARHGYGSKEIGQPTSGRFAFRQRTDRLAIRVSEFAPFVEARVKAWRFSRDQTLAFDRNPNRRARLAPSRP
jgi:hypothetical protein